MEREELAAVVKHISELVLCLQAWTAPFIPGPLAGR